MPAAGADVHSRSVTVANDGEVYQVSPALGSARVVHQGRGELFAAQFFSNPTRQQLAERIVALVSRFVLLDVREKDRLFRRPVVASVASSR